ncbi:hypothetical protein PPERSA_11148 [Pseudocohnilembus persalinus]|uniref:Uncharacterized protein n=1 Tax=Pseudocohnilembus persalinus TaxID=266149 RepID=A0A0V0QZ46_PSEPJ|nr:hypothetical protein PPERSA_11148 [Pseudocohnilembus persalinus]|eukprot:KRX07599.1 hypothetical protein PPERSA_11148 [Pseudocohnilembus persalinus]
MQELQNQEGFVDNIFLYLWMQDPVMNQAVLRVQWSNNLCFFEKIQNPKKLNDKNLDKYQRILTYEIPNTHSEIIQLKGTFLITSLETIANNIKQHIVNLSFERFKITRMNLIFKVIEDNSIIFMGCTNIKLEDRKLSNHNCKQEKNSQAIITIPPNIDTSKLGLYQTSNLKQENQCSSCLKMINDFATYMAKLKSVIQSWEFDHDGKKQLIIDQEKQEILNEQFQSKEQRNKNVASFKSNTNFYQRIQQSQIFIDVERAYNIPKVIRNIMPKIKEEKYLQLKENPGFNDTEVEVCEQCYLDIMSNCNIYESIEKLTKQVGRLDEFHGIGRLKPEQLNLRYNEEFQQNGNDSQAANNNKSTKNLQTQERYQFQAKKDENYNDKTTINNTHNLSTNQTSLLQYNWDQNQLTDPTSINNLEKPNPRRSYNIR